MKKYFTYKKLHFGAKKTWVCLCQMSSYDLYLDLAKLSYCEFAILKSYFKEPLFITVTLYIKHFMKSQLILTFF